MAARKTREQRAAETTRYAQWLKDTGIAEICNASAEDRLVVSRAR